MTTDDLRQRLDQAFYAITPAPAPVDSAMREGARLRWRRRVVVAGSIAAVAAAAIFIPLTVRWQASPPPATGHYTVTVQPPGPHSPAGEIAVGTMNGKRWQILLPSPGPLVPIPKNSPPGTCFQATGPAIGDAPIGILDCAMGSVGPGTGPVSFGEAGNSYVVSKSPPPPPLQAMAGPVKSEVTYIAVTLSNGTTVRLRPAAVDGKRYVAFVAPADTVIKAAAYSSRGEIANAIAFTNAGADWFVTWLSPGQRGIPRAAGLLDSGTVDGKAWSATAYLGPWGVCVFSNFEGGGCAPASAPLGLRSIVSGIRGPGAPPGLSIWTVPSAAVRAVVTVVPGKTFQVRPVMVGVQKFVVFQVPGMPKDVSLTAYDSAGHIVGRFP